MPRDTTAAARLARRHDQRVAGRSAIPRIPRRRLRHAIEVRSERFFVAEMATLARRHGIAIVVSDAAGWPRVEELTAGFVYVRLHGAERTYASAYDDRALDAWAARLERWRDGGEPEDARRISARPPPRRRSRDVYVYFDNDFEANAPHDALQLAARLPPHPSAAVIPTAKKTLTTKTPRAPRGAWVGWRSERLPNGNPNEIGSEHGERSAPAEIRRTGEVG